MKHIEDIAVDKSKSFARQARLDRLRNWWKWKVFPRYYGRKLEKEIENTK